MPEVREHPQRREEQHPEGETAEQHEIPRALVGASSDERAIAEHDGEPHEREPVATDVSRARAELLAKRYKEARGILEPKVLDGKASKEEIRLLRTVCKQDGDRMCVALCDAKLK